MSNAYVTDFRAPAAAGSTALLNEDWLAVILGLFIFVLGLAALVHVDLIGWVVSTSVWSNSGQALGPASKGYAALGGVGALLATYVALTLVLTAGAARSKATSSALRWLLPRCSGSPMRAGSSATTRTSPR